MKYPLSILCLSVPAFLLGQGAATNPIATLGYLLPQPATVAPGQLITVFLEGNIQGAVTASVQQSADYPAPVLEVVPNCVSEFAGPCVPYTSVTIQIPYEMAPNCFVCATPVNYYTQLQITIDGAVPPAAFFLTPLNDHVHILTACDTILPGGSGTAPYFGLPCSPLITHADGSLVTNASPAAAGEVLVAYAVGLGATTPAVATGQAATAATPANQTFSLDFNFRPNALATQPTSTNSPAPLYAGLTPGYVGLYQVNFQVPSAPAGTPACSGAIGTNLTVSVGSVYSFDGAGICVTP